MNVVAIPPSPTVSPAERLAALQARQARREVLFRPSSTERWMACAGSTQLAVGVPADRSSDYAREGTAAHTVAEQALRGIRQPDEWTDRMVQLDDGGLHGVFVKAEMVEAVQVYVDEAAKWRSADCREFVEHRMSLAPLDPDDPLLAQVAGTADHVILDYVCRRIVIRDLKYGVGVPVAPTSPQLRVYGLTALATFPPPEGGWAEVVCEVVQPRLPNEDDRVKSVRYEPVDLLDFLGDVYGALTAAVGDDPPLTPDPTGKWCRRCPAAAQCPALAHRALLAGRDAFGAVPIQATALTPMPPAPREIVLPDPAQAAPDDIATWLDSRAAVETFFTAVAQRAVQLISGGTKVPGWKLVSRSGNRVWADPDTAPGALLELGLTVEAIHTAPKLKSPAQVEKLLPKAKRDAIAEMVTRPEGSPTLVRADDKRDALTPVFGPVIDGEVA
ncbi:MAG: DUF2800 domain-containing protein [Rhodospirillales bacterium]|nr:DUF2800 domain-containing protein [Rhodospirillales bacterium]